MSEAAQLVVEADEILSRIAMTARDTPALLPAALEEIPAPIYLTDRDGWLTHFNTACLDFAGRQPIPGQDRWCVTWRLYTEDGARLPHEECPMAVAIGERRAVRGAVAIAERPDGTKVLFTPYPLPIVDERGDTTGAVNMLIDITDQRQAAALRAQAARCRRLAAGITDRRTGDILSSMALEYEAKAHALEPWVGR